MSYIDAMATATEATVTRIRVRLALANKSQAWLAREIGTTPGYMSSRMTGRKPFTVTELDTIAGVFGTDLVGLISGEAA